MGVTILPKKFYDAKNEQNELLQQIATSLGVTAGNLQDAINIANQASLNAQNKITELNENWNLLTTAQQQDAEVVTARQSTVKNKTFASLDARLEAAEQDLSVHQAEDATDSHTINNIANLQNILDTKITGYNINAVSFLIISESNFDTLYDFIKKTPGTVRLVFRAGNYTIEQLIEIGNKHLIISSYGAEVVNLTFKSHIQLVNSTLNVGGLNIYLNSPRFIIATGNCGISIGGYHPVKFYPADNESKAVVEVNNFITSSDYFITRPSLLSMSIKNIGILTTNIVGYDKTFNVINTIDGNNTPIILKYSSVSKSEKCYFHNGSDTLYKVGESEVYVL